MEVQSAVRRSGRQADGAQIVVGVHHERVLAFGRYLVDRDEQVGAYVFIQLLAVNVSMRGRGGAAADALMEHVLHRAARTLLDVGDLHALGFGNVHRSNLPSQRLLARHGFTPTTVSDGDYVRWAVSLDLC